MGGGCYSYMRDIRTKMSNSSQSREEVFSQNSMNPDMDIRNKIRECRDSEEHPETLPIIIALDVTGSMGRIPHKLITSNFPEIMKKIMDEGIAHPQVCFLEIGDQYSDNAPIQGGQFKSSDELLDKWLKTIWLEEGGGGNGGESYQLAWWFAAAHTSVDHYESNIDNEFQGNFKTGILEIGLLNRAYERHCIDNYVKKYNMSLNLVVTHIDMTHIIDNEEYSIYSWDYLDNSGSPHYNIHGKENILNTLVDNLVYVPDHVYYNDSVESNIKQLK